MYAFEFVFIIASYNNEINVEKNILSVINQSYTKWRIIYINDASTDKTENNLFDILNKYNLHNSPKFIYLKNETQMRQMYSKYRAYQMVKDFEIVCILDGDDYLYSSKVLKTLNIYYNTLNCDVLTSNFMVKENNKLSLVKTMPYTKNIIEYKNFRYVPYYSFKHLKSGFGIYFKSIPKEYFMIQNKWIARCTDMAEMYAVCELSKRIVSLVPDVTYVYNKDNSLLYKNSFYNLKMDNNNQSESETENEREYNEIVYHYKSMNKMSYKLPYIFIINMKKDTTKKYKIIGQMSYIHSKNYSFWEATDGINDETIIKLVNSIVSPLDNSVLNTCENMNVKRIMCICNMIKKNHVTPPALGLIDSVLKLFHNIANQNTEFSHIVLLEDDIYTIKDFDFYNHINEKLLQNKDVVYLGCQNQKANGLYRYEQWNYIKSKRVKYNHNIYERINEYDDRLYYGTYALILSKKFILYFLSYELNDFVKMNLSFDIFLNFIRMMQRDPEFNLKGIKECGGISFYKYFVPLFIPEVRKPGIQNTRTIEFYKNNNIDLKQYYI